MSRLLPVWLAVTCVGLWLLQSASAGLAVQRFWSVPAETVPWFGWAAVAASAVLGGVLLFQLARALQWRRQPRPTRGAAVKAERQRIARDLHDHLGSQLVCALALLEAQPARAGEVVAVLQKCMLDLRLIVDSMDSADSAFVDRLARLRYRIQPVLDQRGIRMAWDVDIPAQAKALPSEASAHLLAIVQEALSNVLQHAHATEVAVAVKYSPATNVWQVQVSDDGGGIHPQRAEADVHLGQGLQGMRLRAQLAGGDLVIAPRSGGGTSVRATVPGPTLD
jgi:signal transduction histidine kinase